MRSECEHGRMGWSRRLKHEAKGMLNWREELGVNRNMSSVNEGGVLSIAAAGRRLSMNGSWAKWTWSRKLASNSMPSKPQLGPDFDPNLANLTKLGSKSGLKLGVMCDTLRMGGSGIWCGGGEKKEEKLTPVARGSINGEKFGIVSCRRQVAAYVGV
ncbi:hypothetical protein K438DRAFT_1755458 [Mycena galopus ATCC 62051]|nr:hypothetical protein K438DRAFT_1755458 [Mycena galopus ATCC 62051]